jgi:lysophospholipase L1-like esterase
MSIFLKLVQIRICQISVRIGGMKCFLNKRIHTRLFSLMNFITGLVILLIFTFGAKNKMSHTLLCLGDSYTIGEGVTPGENFPNQTFQLLTGSGYDFQAPEIIAKTGWTTDELQNEINSKNIHKSYDFVTLLIGVNNQYRGRSVEDYEPGFESLLKQAIRLANGKADRVIVLSIPDWGVTPFAADRNRSNIAKDIDRYNEANKKIALEHHVNYVDVTPGTREASTDPTRFAPDGLHPSGKEYAKWSEKLYLLIQRYL